MRKSANRIIQRITSPVSDQRREQQAGFQLEVREIRKRIDRIRKEFASDSTLKDLKKLLKAITVQTFLDWKGTRKSQTFLDLIALLDREGINTEDDLRKWLQHGESAAKLRKVAFIGPKTADYLKILVGEDSAAIDRHVLGFLERAGLGKLNYERAQEIVHQTAEDMGLKRSQLDFGIWRHMSRYQAK